MLKKGVTPQEFCDSFLEKISDLRAVVITDKEGTEIVTSSKKV